MSNKPQEEKKPARDYTPFDVNFRELFTLLTGTMARDIHQPLHRVFDALLGHHVSCDDFSKAWFSSHQAVSKQFPEVTAWLKAEWGLTPDQEFAESNSEKLTNTQINGIIDRGRVKFGDKFSVTPVDRPKGKELIAMALGILAGMINEKMQDMEENGTLDTGEVDLGDGATMRIMAGGPRDVKEVVDKMMDRQRTHHRGKKDHWPN